MNSYAKESASLYSKGYEARCQSALDFALDSAPAYFDWRKLDIGGDDPFERLAALPVLDKALMRRYGPAGFLPQGMALASALSKGEVEIVNTSGSTGDQVSNIWSQEWWNASEQASWQLNAFAANACGKGHKEAILSSPLCVGFPCEDAFLPKARRTVGSFLFLNERVDPSKWPEPLMRRMVAELDELKPEIIEANPSYLARLARFMLQEGLRLSFKPKLITFTYENPSLFHRRSIEKAFGSPMASSYGSTEAGYVFMQCEAGYFHQNSDFCHVDFIPFSESAGAPEGAGSLLVSSFGNKWRSLLRFDIGDIAIASKEPCPCGRSHGLTLKSIEGRAVNLTLRQSGRLVTQAELDRRLFTVDGLAEYQLLQDSPEAARILFAGDPGANTSKIESAMRECLRELYGSGMRFEFQAEAGLPPDPPGKYRLSKPLFPIDARSFWDIDYAPPQIEEEAIA